MKLICPRLNVGIITLGFQPPWEENCLPWQNEFVKRLSEFCQVRVFPQQYPNQKEIYQLDNIPVFPQLSLRLPKLGILQAMHRQLKCLEREHYKQRFDIIHAIWATESAKVGKALAKRQNLPFVVSITGGELMNIPDIRYGGQLHGYSRRGIRQNLAAADRIFVLSKYTQKQCHHLFPELKSKVRILPWGLDLQMFKPINQIQKAPSPPLKIITVASLRKVKEHATLLHGIKEAKAQKVPLSLKIIGQGTAENTLRKLSKELDLEQEITFCGEIPHQDIPLWFQQADVVALTSRHESQCMAIIEGMACGLPAIGTQVGALPDIIKNGQNGFCFPVGDAKACGQALRTLAQNPELIYRMGERARLDCLRQYDSRERTLAIYKEYKEVIRLETDSFPG